MATKNAFRTVLNERAIMERTRPGIMHNVPVGPAQEQGDPMAELLRLRAENAALKARKGGGISWKVSEKGGLSVYGLGKWPVTLYREQWERLLAHAPQILEFIADNADELKTKD